ncbi:MAG: AraC family transcriptional regulator [Pseudomonadales bacterium]|nr:AraC family transcriptional regulator [Pseudomonadales bacterium]
MTQEGFYVTGIALSQFVLGAESLGVDGKQILACCGLRDEHLNPTSRVPENQYEMLILQLALASKNDSFGADIGQQLMPPLYGSLMSLALSSPTLGEAFKNMSNYQALASGNCGGVDYIITDTGAKFSISMTHHNPVVRIHVAECVLTMFCSLATLVSAKKDLTPEAIYLEHSPYSEFAKRHFEKIVQCPVHWNHEETYMQLGKVLHAYPIHGHGEEALRIAREFAQAQLDNIQAQTSIIETIKWHTRELMQSRSPRRETVAERLGISTSTLDRRLKEAGMNWQELLDNLRVQLAIEYLSNQELSVSEIADKLGFSEIRAFQRRFKRWTGMTPSNYRKEILGTS